jgi:hypothetical protein
LEAGQLSYFDNDNHIAVVGWDLPEWNQWRVGSQYSYDIIEGKLSALGRGKSEQLISVRLGREWSNGHSLTMIHGLNPTDGSSLSTFNATFARSSRLEFLFGLESVQGRQNSQFGPFKNGSRVLVGLRGNFDG